jgi:hydrogenase maturation protein HypF
LRAARAVLDQGGVVALRGIGGFALVVHPRRPGSVARLRRLKRRPDKPLALMAASLDVARRACTIDEHGATALGSAAAPIALLPRLPGCDGLPTDELAQDTDALGVMLPTSPLHHLLFHPLPGDPTPPFDWLVVTSGNRAGEPLCLATEEALERLDFADLVLTHDRDIAWRCDDSVVLPTARGVVPLRRARGLAPEPVQLRRPLDRVVLALGAELKNTVACGADGLVVLSPHLGDTLDPDTLDACEAMARALPQLLGRRPDVVAVDLHPDQGPTRLGERLAAELGVPIERVQHHHAHAVACLAEHGCEAGLALVWDGVGLGTDGALWGGELLRVEPGRFERLGTLLPAPLPGGDAATAEPLRQVVGRLAAIDPARVLAHYPGDAAARVWAQQAASGVHAPLSHAVGRLFDAVAVVLGLAPARVTWEGQAAVRLEAAARRAQSAPRLPLPVERGPGGLWILDWRPLFEALLAPTSPPDAMALAFHEALARGAADQVREACPHGRSLPVALSGGVFQNRLLAERVREALERDGWTVIEHRQVPPNDGGIALGQAVVAGRVG